MTRRGWKYVPLVMYGPACERYCAHESCFMAGAPSLWMMPVPLDWEPPRTVDLNG